MLYKQLTQSVMDLLSFLGVPVTGEPETVREIQDVQKILQGSGHDVTLVDVIRGSFTHGSGAKGGIFINPKDQKFYSFFLNDAGVPEFLDKTENKESLTAILQSCPYAWLIREKKQKFDSLSPFFRQYGKHFWDILVAALLINFFALIFPLFSSFVYDKVMGNGIYETLWALSICLFIVMVIEYLLRLIRLKATERFAVSTEIDIDFGIFKRLLTVKLNALPSVAGLLEKYKQILSYRDFFSSSYLLSLVDVPFLFLFLLAILVTAGPMVLLVVVFGGLMSTISVLMLKPILEEEFIAKNASEQRFSLLTDLLISREIVLGKAISHSIETKLRHSSFESASASSRARYWRGVGMSLSNSLSYLSYVAVLVMGVYMVEDHKLTAGGLLAVSMLSSRAMTTISSVSGLVLRYREFSIAMKSFEALLPQTKAPNYVTHGKLSGDIRIENLTFKPREDAAPLFDNINLHFRSGEIVGIAGTPGAGKTTLLRMILGLMPPDKGRIMLDDIPSDMISPEDVSMSIGYKPQELCLMDGTIEENVRAGRPVMNSDDRKDILISSGLEFAFRENSLNWQSDVGMRGAKLSGGQRQLVSLARTLAYHPSLILLDEPTNGLDAALEDHVKRQLLALKGKATVIVSTHSHAVLSACDRIIVLGQGKILADGPREKVLMPQTQNKPK